MTKKALVLGVTGQCGSYLCDILLQKDYEVHGVYRRVSGGNLHNLALALSMKNRDGNSLVLHQGDMGDPLSIARIIREVQPNELYNMADQDHIGWSYEIPSYNYDITGAAVGRTLEAIKFYSPRTRVFQPVSATMFGGAPPPQNEDTTFDPQSPYACAKVIAYYLCQYYRKVQGLYINCGIMFNHDSTRRKGDYLLHSIAKQAVEVANETKSTITVGDSEMRVDIGYSREFMETVTHSMWLEKSINFVLGTGIGFTIAELARSALIKAVLLNDISADRDDPSLWNRISTDPELVRPGAQPTLIADTSQIRKLLPWKPQYTAPKLISMLVNHYHQNRENS